MCQSGSDLIFLLLIASHVISVADKAYFRQYGYTGSSPENCQPSPGTFAFDFCPPVVYSHRKAQGFGYDTRQLSAFKTP